MFAVRFRNGKRPNFAESLMHYLILCSCVQCKKTLKLRMRIKEAIKKGTNTIEQILDGKEKIEKSFETVYNIMSRFPSAEGYTMTPTRPGGVTVSMSTPFELKNSQCLLSRLDAVNNAFASWVIIHPNVSEITRSIFHQGPKSFLPDFFCRLMTMISI
jgi:hypothetical protein